MKTLKGLITSVAIASMTLLSYPRDSFAIDCSYGGVIQPPLPIEDGLCIASGTVRTTGSLILDPSSALFYTGGLKLLVREEPNQQFPFVQIPGTLLIPPGGVLGTHPPVLNPVEITAAGAIIMNGGFAFNLWAPTDPITVRAAKGGISLQGDFQNSPFLPTTFMLGDTVKVEATRGNITVNNASFNSIGDSADVSFVAPRGSITFTDTLIVVLKEGSEVGECTFQAKNQQVTFGPGTALFCNARIKK
jgi:hypothetical protein